MFNNRTLWDRFRGLAAAISCSVLLGVALTPRAAADVADKKTIVTFNAPVAVTQLILSITIIGMLITIFWVLVDAFLIPGWVRRQNNLLAVQLGA